MAAAQPSKLASSKGVYSNEHANMAPIRASSHTAVGLWSSPLCTAAVLTVLLRLRGSLVVSGATAALRASAQYPAARSRRLVPRARASAIAAACGRRTAILPQQVCTTLESAHSGRKVRGRDKYDSA